MGVALLGLTACGEQPDGSTVSRVDSAGVEVVSNTGGAWGSEEGWVIDTQPDRTLGAMEGSGPESFGRVTDVAALPDGSIAVVDGQASHMVLFDPDGQLEGTLGGPGDGPGEFQGPTEIADVSGDTLFVWDAGNRRLSWFLHSGQFLGSRDLSGLEFGGQPARLAEVAVLPSGTVIGREGQDLVTGEELGVYRDTTYWLLAPPESEEVRTLASAPGMWTERREIQGRPAFRSQFLTAVPKWAVHSEDLFVTSGDGFEVRRFDMEGLQAIYRVEREPREVTESDRAAVEEAALAPVPEAQRAAVRPLLEGMTLPSRVPAYSSLLVDPEGAAWAEHYAVPGFEEPGPAWDVFGPDGQYRGEVETPEGLKILDVTTTHVLGVWSDELGVQYVHRHPLQR